MVRYLLVDDRDGRVLVELAGPAQAARLAARYNRSPSGDLPVRVVRVAEHEGSLIGVASLMSVRPLLEDRRRDPDSSSRAGDG